MDNRQMCMRELKLAVEHMREAERLGQRRSKAAKAVVAGSEEVPGSAVGFRRWSIW